MCSSNKQAVAIYHIVLTILSSHMRLRYNTYRLYTCLSFFSRSITGLLKYRMASLSPIKDGPQTRTRVSYLVAYAVFFFVLPSTCVSERLYLLYLCSPMPRSEGGHRVTRASSHRVYNRYTMPYSTTISIKTALDCWLTHLRFTLMPAQYTL